MFKQRFPHITTLAAYGCSYTAGAELGDHLILPGAETIKRKQGFDNWWDLFTSCVDAELKHTVNEHELYHAWPSQAARALGLVSCNRAQAATSLGLAVWRFEQDILERRLDAKNTLFVFGVTTTDPCQTVCSHSREYSAPAWFSQPAQDLARSHYYRYLFRRLSIMESSSTVVKTVSSGTAAGCCHCGIQYVW